MKNCNACGAANQTIDKFCRACGAPLPQAPAEEPAAQAQAPMVDAAAATGEAAAGNNRAAGGFVPDDVPGMPSQAEAAVDEPPADAAQVADAPGLANAGNAPQAGEAAWATTPPNAANPVDDSASTTRGEAATDPTATTDVAADSIPDATGAFVMDGAAPTAAPAGAAPPPMAAHWDAPAQDDARWRTSTPFAPGGASSFWDAPGGQYPPPGQPQACAQPEQPRPTALPEAPGQAAFGQPQSPYAEAPAAPGQAPYAPGGAPAYPAAGAAYPPPAPGYDPPPGYSAPAYGAPVAPGYGAQPPVYPPPTGYGAPRPAKGPNRRAVGVVAGGLAAVLLLLVLLVSWQASRGGVNSNPTLPASRQQPVFPSAPPNVPAPQMPPAAAGPVPAGYFACFTAGEERYLFAANGAASTLPLAYSSYQQTADGLLCYFEVEQEDSYRTDLYLLSAQNETRLVATDVQYPTLCADNDIAFYLSGQSHTDLYRYSYSQDTAQLVATDVREYTVSPSGSYVLFSNREYLTVIPGQGGSIQRLDAQPEPTPLAIADDGESYAYTTVDYEQEPTLRTVYFCALQGGTQATVEWDGYGAALYQNRTGSQLLLGTETGLYLFAGGQLSRLAETPAATITPYLGAQGPIATGGVRKKSLLCEDFSAFFYAVRPDDTGDVTLYACIGGTSTKVGPMRTMHDAVSTAQPGQLLYLEDESLCRASIDGDAANVQRVTDDVSGFTASGDGTTVVFTRWEYNRENSDASGDALYLLDEAGSETRLAEEVTRFWLGGDGRSLTYLCGGKPHRGQGGAAYYYTGGESTLVAENALYISPPSATGTFFYTAGATEVDSYTYEADLYAWAEGEARQLAVQVELREPTWGLDWYNHFCGDSY